jgi:hypothetical protein
LRKNQPYAVRGRLRLRPTVTPLEGRELLSTFTVTSTADNGRAGTLRWAIEKANANNQADKIVFACLAFDTPQTITLTRGPLILTNRAITTITGPGENLLKISGNNTSRVFEITPRSTASLSGLTITGGRVSGNGGGVENTGGNLTLTNVILRDSVARDGGGLFNSGSATLTDVVLRGNHAREGGGLFNDGSAALTDVVIRDNHARVGSRMFSTPEATLTWGGRPSRGSTGTIVNYTFDANASPGAAPTGWMQILGAKGDINETARGGLKITDSTGNYAGIAYSPSTSAFNPQNEVTDTMVTINSVNTDGNAIFGVIGFSATGSPTGYIAAGIDAKGNVFIVEQEQGIQANVPIGKDSNYNGGMIQMDFKINDVNPKDPYVEVTAPGFDSKPVYFSSKLDNFSLATAFGNGAVPALVGASQPTTFDGSASFAKVTVSTQATARRR